MKLANNVLEMIGGTPLVKLNKVVPSTGAEIYVKLEWQNPGGSVKTRIALSMIEAAENDNKIQKGCRLIEPTSGNTGIGVALVGSIKGYRVSLIMPESASKERRQIMRAYGAEVILTPADQGMKGAIEKAKEILLEDNNAFMLQQFENYANPAIHEKTTAMEIWEDLDHRLDVFVSAIGTGGTVTGVGTMLKKLNNRIRVVGVEPSKSAVLSGNLPGPHKIQGIGAGFVPKILNREILDEIVQVKDDDAFETSRKLAKEEGLLAGISSGAAVWSAIYFAEKHPQYKRIVVILPDGGERYLSADLYP